MYNVSRAEMFTIHTNKYDFREYLHHALRATKKTKAHCVLHMCTYVYV